MSPASAATSRAPDSAARMRLARPESLPQLYALAALALVDSAGARAVLAAYQAPVTTVSVAEGRQVRERPVRELVREVETGYWSRELTKRPSDVH